MGKSILLEKNARKIADIASENLGEEIILYIFHLHKYKYIDIVQ